MAEEKKDDGRLAEQLGVGLLKELTISLVELTKSVRALMGVCLGVPPEGDDEGQTGVIAQLASLQDSVDELDEHMVGQNIKLSGIEWVLDRLADIYEGDAEAQPPLPGREPTMKDAVLAWTEYRKKMEEEAEQAIKEAEEQAKGEEAADAAEAGATEPPPRPPMLSNSQANPPMFKKLPPLPVVAPPE